MSFNNNRIGDGMAPGSMPTAPGNPASPALRPQVVRSVRMHPLLAAGVGGFVFLALLGYGLTRKPMYSAEALVYEEPASSKLLSDGTAGTFDSNRYESYLDQQKQVMARPDVLDAAIASLPPQTWRVLGPNPKAAQENLAAQLKVDRVKTSYQLSISLQSSDPAAAAAIVNAVTAAYLKEVHKDTVAQTDQRAQLLGEERRRIEGELQTTREEQAGLSASLGVASPLGESGNPYDFELASVRQQLLTARQTHDAAAAQLASLSGGGANDSALAAAADETIGGDTGLASMRATVSARRATLNGQMAGMKPENPVYKQDLEELADLDKTLETMTRQTRAKAEGQLQSKLRTELERSGDVESRLNAQLAQLTGRASTAAPKLQRAAELSEDLQRLNLRYAAVDDTLRSVQLEANGPGIVRLSLAAAVPTTPEPGRKMLLLLAAPLLGLMCGVGAAVIARKRDRRLYSGRDVEDVLGFAPMAVLPARADVSSRVLDEYVLRLAAGLESAYRNNGAQTFLLTAVSAATDTRPLRKALMARLKRIGLDVALARPNELLLGDPGAVLEGRREPARAGISEGFVAAHLARLKEEHALVIIDAPALGTSAETEYVARCADATILVAECGVTTREELLQSAQLLQRLHARGVGAVLQEMPLRLADQSFRDAIAAFEQRQPDRSYSAERSAVRPRVATAEVAETRTAYGFAVDAPEPAVASAVEPVLHLVQPPRPVFVEATQVLAEEPAAEEEEPIVGRARLLHEKMTPTLPGPGEPTPDGEQPMSKSWFHRFLHPDEEKVSILPEPGKEDAPVDEAWFLQSRISRSMNVYGTAAQEGVASGAQMTQPESERFVLGDMQTIQHGQEQLHIAEEEDPAPAQVGAMGSEWGAEPMVEEHAPAVVEHAAAPSAVEVVDAPLPVGEIGAQQPVMAAHGTEEAVARVRPTRPMSFHQLAGLAGGSVKEQVAVASEVEPEEEMVHAVELPAEWMEMHMPAEESSAAVEQEPGISEAADEPATISAPVEVEAAPVEDPGAPVQQEFESVAEQAEPEPVYTLPVVSRSAVWQPAIAQNGPQMVIAPEHSMEVATEARDEALPRAFTSPVGTSRWDPIPPLRPTDSGWNRMHGANGSNGGNGHGSNGHGSFATNGKGAVVERPRRAEEQAARGERRHGYIGQRWEEDEVGGEQGEPALSRPWGLLSRFQQTHLITPARKNGNAGYGNGGSGNGGGNSGNGHEEHDREPAPDPLQSGRKG